MNDAKAMMTPVVSRGDASTDVEPLSSRQLHAQSYAASTVLAHKVRELRELKEEICERVKEIDQLKRRSSELEEEKTEAKDKLTELSKDLTLLHGHVEQAEALKPFQVLADRFDKIEAGLEQMQGSLSTVADVTRSLDAATRKLHSSVHELSPLISRAEKAEAQRARIERLRELSFETAGRRLTLREEKATQAALERTGVFVPQSVVHDCLVALQEGRALLLLGPPGTGKTTLADHLRALFLAGDSEIAMSREVAIDEWDSLEFVGGAVAGADPHLGVFTKAVLEAVESPRWLFVDELNRANPNNVLAPLMHVLNGSVAGKRLPLLSSHRCLDDGELVIPGDFRFICAMNEYDGQYLHPMTPEFERRFRIVRLEPPPRDVELRLLEAHVLREHREEGWKRARPLAERTVDLLEQVRERARSLHELRLNLGSSYAIDTVEHALSLLGLNHDLEQCLDAALASAIVERLAPARSQTFTQLAQDVFPSHALPECNRRLHYKLAHRSPAQEWGG